MAKKKQKQTNNPALGSSALVLKNIKPMTKTQAEFFANYDTCKSQVLMGSSGTGKTFLSLYKALQEVRNPGSEYNRIVIVRSAVPTRDMGFLPGPQPLSCGILTPEGWTTMGELAVGDFVVGVDGSPTEVLEVHDFEEEDVYEIKTTTGKTTYATDSHLWETQNYNDFKHNKPGSVKTTNEIRKSLFYKNGKINHHLPYCSPCGFSPEKKSLHPYALGVLLGDGSLSNSVSFASIDLDIVNRMKEVLDSLRISVNPVNNSISYNLCSNDGRANKPKGPNSTGRFTNPIKQELNRLGLMFKHFDTKFIPDSYIYSASVEDRMELLRGLLDTDGTVHRGRAEFFTSSKQLALDVQELVRSLGGSVSLTVRDRTKEAPKLLDGRKIQATCLSYCCCILLPKTVGNPFYLPRKAKQYITEGADGRQLGTTSDRICSVTYHSTEPVRCIKVASARHLYITDDYIVTHNTLQEKGEVYELPYKAICNELFRRGDAYEILRKHRDIEFITTSFIRGITLDHTIIIVDECQSLNGHELESIVTRAGKSTKIMFCGDFVQTDLTKFSEKEGSKKFMQVVENMPDDFSINKFSEQDIVRSGLVRAYLLQRMHQFPDGI